MGRKKKKIGERKTNILKVMLTEKDRAAIDAEAAAFGLDTSTWVRLKILELIRQSENAKK